MISFESLLLFLTLTLLIAGSIFLFVVLRSRASTEALESLDRGDFREALAHVESEADPERDDLMAGAIAAKHLVDFERADTLLDRILAADVEDGEAWLERALVAAYSGRFDAATAALDRSLSLRADLLESVTLHRAWIALRSQEARRAKALFDEIEIPLETKLRQDLGEGDAAFADWFYQAGDLWKAKGDPERASWAHDAARGAAPESRLFDHLAGLQ